MLCARELHDKALCIILDLLVQREPAAVQLRDAFGNGKPEPAAVFGAARFIRNAERLKQIFADFIRQPDAGICNHNFDTAV